MMWCDVCVMCCVCDVVCVCCVMYVCGVYVCVVYDMYVSCVYVCVCRRAFLHQRRSPSPASSSATEESAKPPPRPPPPKAPSPPPVLVQRPLSAKRRERTIINMPSEQIRDEVNVTRPSPRKYEIGSQTDRHLLEEYDQVS